MVLTGAGTVCRNRIPWAHRTCGNGVSSIFTVLLCLGFTPHLHSCTLVHTGLHTVSTHTSGHTLPSCRGHALAVRAIEGRQPTAPSSLALRCSLAVPRLHGCTLILLCNIPGLASNTHGGPSASLCSMLRVCRR